MITTQYGRRVAELEAQGLTTSDAQGVADTEGLDDTRSDTKQAIIDALRAFLATRPGFDPLNYGDMASYRADMRTATRQRHDAERFLRDVELRDSITADDILREAQGGRLEIHACTHGNNAATSCGCGTQWCGDCSPAPAAMCHRCNGGERNPMRPNEVRIHYTAGQYYCTEYRGAVARLLASVLWAWKRDKAMPDLSPDKTLSSHSGKVRYKHVSPGDWLRASFRREYGRGIADRYFS